MIPYLDTHKLIICRTSTPPHPVDLQRRIRNAVTYGLRHAHRVSIVSIKSRASGRSLVVTRADDPVVTERTCVITLAAPVADDAWHAVYDNVDGELR